MLKSVLIIIPYDPIYPPLNGGMQRCFHILHQLSLNFKVTAIINQDKDSFNIALADFPALASVELYSTNNVLEVVDTFSLFPGRIKNALRYRWYKRNWKVTTDSNFLKYYPILKRLLKTERFDAVILENLDTINAVDVIRRYDKKISIIYDAHNIDSILAQVKLEKGLIKRKEVERIIDAESNLHRKINAVMACSEKDRDGLMTLNDDKLNVVVIPNGVLQTDRFEQEGVLLENPRYILFCGSLQYEPNAEGIGWFYFTTWPQLQLLFPRLKLMLITDTNFPVGLKDILNDSSVQVTGTVPDVKPYYNKASVAIVPLKSGSGTRLKLLEAMGMGVPVISTGKGAEGIEYNNGSDILIADTETEFLQGLSTLLNNKQKRLDLQQGALKLVEQKYNWNIVGRSLAAFIQSITNS